VTARVDLADSVRSWADKSLLAVYTSLVTSNGWEHKDADILIVRAELLRRMAAAR
jgi:hypothetical protein